MDLLPVILSETRNYNLHSHTQFCDGRATMHTMAEVACNTGMKYYGFSPHSPIPLISACNMKEESVSVYLSESYRLKEKYSGKMLILTAMEVDWLGPEFGPHIDYFRNLPLDYSIGSVHFIKSQDGIYYDCDGSSNRFVRILRKNYKSDLQYVVETYFTGILQMLELGGFQILGHFDKISGNASVVAPDIEQKQWYRALVSDVISKVASTGIIVEINTKAYNSHGRFYPSSEWFQRLIESGVPLAINSDAHTPESISVGRMEAFELLNRIKNEGKNGNRR